jgi:hypothetical protein
MILTYSTGGINRTFLGCLRLSVICDYPANCNRSLARIIKVLLCMCIYIYIIGYVVTATLSVEQDCMRNMRNISLAQRCSWSLRFCGMLVRRRYRCFGTAYRSNLRGSSQEEWRLGTDTVPKRRQPTTNLRYCAYYVVCSNHVSPKKDFILGWQLTVVI